MLMTKLVYITVLPTFKVEVSAMEKIIALTTDWFLVNTRAV